MTHPNRLLSILLVFLLAGCAHNPSHPQDPYEPVNRKIYAFNDTLDRMFMKPVAQGYDKIMPDPVKKSVSNFFDNMLSLQTIANNVLQLRPFRTGESTLRLLINSTVGIAGLFDPATSMGLERKKQDFGLTLAFWGYENSDYMMLPFLGPSTFRDTIGFAVDEYIFTPYHNLDNKKLRDSLNIARSIDMRYRLLETDKFMEDALDRYQLQRDAYLQNREHLIRKNQTSVETEEQSQPSLDAISQESGAIHPEEDTYVE